MYVFANVDATVRWRQSKVHLRRGVAWPKTDPFVKERPEFFDTEPPVVHHTREYRPVEEATANPGERRRTKRGS